MTTEEIIARSQQAEAAMNNFLSPAFTLIQAEYTQRLQEVAVTEPWATDKIRKLAVALKIAREVEAQITGIVRSGEVAEHEKKRADVIASMSDEKRKWALAAGR